jgi:hypothetical protein
MLNNIIEPLEELNMKWIEVIKDTLEIDTELSFDIFDEAFETSTHRLIKEIDNSNLSFEEKNFLIDAARRHNVFNYEKIADYYAHSSKEMQYFMERSALVIIDFEDAIQYGYVKLCEEIKKQYLEEYGE